MLKAFIGSLIGLVLLGAAIAFSTGEWLVGFVHLMFFVELIRRNVWPGIEGNPPGDGSNPVK